MTSGFAQGLRHWTAALALSLCATAGFAAPEHGIAMYGAPALPPDFVSLPQANPDAPKGGRIVFGESGAFDSLNPFIVKGAAPAGVSLLTTETLMGRNYDEPFSLYGVLAETIDTDAAHSYVEFTLREGAKFSDGSPVTVDDVLWSFEKLGAEGSPRYATAWKKIAKSEQTGDRSVRFTFTEADREMPLLLGLRPILKKSQWDGKDFTASTLEAPIGSGPYVVGEFEAGKFVSFTKNPDWWGKDLPFNRGQHNFDEVRYEYFGDGGVVFEAFKAGEITAYRETNPAKWAENYAYPAVQSGDVIKSEIKHQRPSGISGFVFNTRKPIFADYRVRQALIDAFNFELVNQTLNGGVLPRICSYFCNSELAGDAANPASAKVAALLQSFAADLLPGTLEGYKLLVSDGTPANRAGLRSATDLMEQAGWTVQDGILKDATGAPFAFEILLVNGQDDMIASANIYTEALKNLGVDVKVTTVDSAQYKERTTAYDFDMTYYTRGVSLSPGNEQTLYWGSAGITEPGTRNWMGMNSPAAEAMIKTMVSSTNRDDFVAATQALDRILFAGRYVIPLWYSDTSYLAHEKSLRFPEKIQIYGDWLGFMPETWWYQE